ncbi:MAG: hypothetical protein OXI96_04230 [Acidimicrobiaceae bacterium]|nr:hypothetical protein [Acidimicrobiaceae bacterium]
MADAFESGYRMRFTVEGDRLNRSGVTDAFESGYRMHSRTPVAALRRPRRTLEWYQVLVSVVVVSPVAVLEHGEGLLRTLRGFSGVCCYGSCADFTQE